MVRSLWAVQVKSSTVCSRLPASKKRPHVNSVICWTEALDRRVELKSHQEHIRFWRILTSSSSFLHGFQNRVFPTHVKSWYVLPRVFDTAASQDPESDFSPDTTSDHSSYWHEMDDELCARHELKTLDCVLVDTKASRVGGLSIHAEANDWRRCRKAG